MFQECGTLVSPVRLNPQSYPAWDIKQSRKLATKNKRTVTCVFWDKLTINPVAQLLTSPGHLGDEFFQN